jgi:transposase-like protein
MVRNKKRKTETHGQTDPDLMKRAVNTVIEGRASLRQTAKDTGIKKSTLQRYVKLAQSKGGTGKR